jgi:hypothetical protein
VALNIRAASAPIQRDPYAALARRSAQERGRELEALSSDSESSERGRSAASSFGERHRSVGESEVRPVFRLQEADIAGPARAALSAYRSIADTYFSHAGGGELVGIDLYV